MKSHDLDTAFNLSSQTRNRTQPSFHNKYAFLKKIDQLPGGPEWMCDVFELDGDVPDENGILKTEEIELWRRDPVDCIRELIGNPTFREFLKYAPEKLFEKMDGSGRIYDETWTGDWWWEMQVSIGSLACGM